MAGPSASDPGPMRLAHRGDWRRAPENTVAAFLAAMAIPAGADGLTDTERRVAALVTQGHSNREVAAVMFVTENTVQTHLRHIFQKVGVRSRTELAARLLSAPAGTLEYH